MKTPVVKQPIAESPCAPTGRPKRAQVKNACVNCQRACKKCDDTRPCIRCTKFNLGDTCADSERKERTKGLRRGEYKRINNIHSLPVLGAELSRRLSARLDPVTGRSANHGAGETRPSSSERLAELMAAYDATKQRGGPFTGLRPADALALTTGPVPARAQPLPVASRRLQPLGGPSTSESTLPRSIGNPFLQPVPETGLASHPRPSSEGLVNRSDTESPPCEHQDPPNVRPRAPEGKQNSKTSSTPSTGRHAQQGQVAKAAEFEHGRESSPSSKSPTQEGLKSDAESLSEIPAASQARRSSTTKVVAVQTVDPASPALSSSAGPAATRLDPPPQPARRVQGVRQDESLSPVPATTIPPPQCDPLPPPPPATGSTEPSSDWSKLDALSTLCSAVLGDDKPEPVLSAQSSPNECPSAIGIGSAGGVGGGGLGGGYSPYADHFPSFSALLASHPPAPQPPHYHDAYYHHPYAHHPYLVPPPPPPPPPPAPHPYHHHHHVHPPLPPPQSHYSYAPAYHHPHAMRPTSSPYHASVIPQCYECPPPPPPEFHHPLPPPPPSPHQQQQQQSHYPYYPEYRRWDCVGYEDTSGRNGEGCGGGHGQGYGDHTRGRRGSSGMLDQWT